jgi:hypothetical protein
MLGLTQFAASEVPVVVIPWENHHSFISPHFFIARGFLVHGTLA